jgi:hypothetical protein
MIDTTKKIISTLWESCAHHYRDMLDYSGSTEVKNYSHTSTIIRRFNDGDLERILELHDICLK